MAVLRMADDRPAILASEAKRVFERYYRGNAAEALPGSVGTGLSVSRQLAEMMGGAPCAMAPVRVTTLS